jgi:hypothetical protein
MKWHLVDPSSHIQPGPPALIAPQALDLDPVVWVHAQCCPPLLFASPPPPPAMAVKRQSAPKKPLLIHQQLLFPHTPSRRLTSFLHPPQDAFSPESALRAGGEGLGATHRSDASRAAAAATVSRDSPAGKAASRDTLMALKITRKQCVYHVP